MSQQPASNLIQVPTEALKGLVSIATGHVRHVYMGMCPDQVEGPDVRDGDCPACQLLTRADGILSGLD
ncbi:hypothetical protein QX25_18365 (plasmid) [Stutzerimonas stutzeri]|jgi:hypothetical protein|nr:hypothetical protein QX25_18365 [Stutzerimonas stutzeri]